MKKLFSLFLALLLVLCCFSSFAATIPTELPTGKLTASAKLYKKASTKGGTVATLKKGATVELIGESGSYYRVVSGNKAGYVLKKYFKSASDTKKATTETFDFISLKNPAKIGETVTVEVPKSEKYEGSGTFEVTIESVVSGDAAYQKLQKWGMIFESSSEPTTPARTSNTTSAALEEEKNSYKDVYYAAYVTVKMVKDTSGSGKGFKVNYTQFFLTDANGLGSSYNARAYQSELLEAHLYEGSTASGYVPLYKDVKKDYTGSFYAHFWPEYAVSAYFNLK